MSEAILRTKLTGDSAELQRALREGIDSAKEFGAEMGKQMREVALQITGVVFGVESVKEGFEKTFEGVKGVIELSKDLRNLSNQTGASVKDLVQLRAEFDLSGIASDHVGNTLNRMQRAIENAADKGGEASDIFARLGLNVYELQKLNPAQQFEQLRLSLSQIEDPARRAQVAMKLFGNMGGGGNILAVFGNAGIAKEAAEAIGAQADILARNANTFQEVAMNMELASIRIEGFFVGMAEPISRIILPVLKQLNSVDLTKWGESIGGSIAAAMRTLYNAFEGGELSHLIGLSLEVGFQEAGNLLAGGLKATAMAFGDTILGFFNKDFADGVGNVFIGIAEQFGAAMMKALNEPINALQSALSYGIDRHQAADNRTAAIKNAMAYGNIADKEYAQGTALQNNGSQAAANKHFAIADSARDKEKVAADQAADYEALQRMTLSEYMAKHKDDAVTFFGQTAGDMDAQGKADATKGRDELAPILETTLKKAFADIGAAASLNVFGDKSKELSDLMAKLSKKIPGEGEENAPARGYQGGGDDGRFGNIQGIAKDAQGNWTFASSGSNGAVSFGDAGSAGQAGTRQASPDGKSPAETQADILKILTKIEADITGITAPA